MGSQGATTLKNKHFEIERTDVLLDFPGKSGQQRQVKLVNTKLANIIGRCYDRQEARKHESRLSFKQHPSRPSDRRQVR